MSTISYQNIPVNLIDDIDLALLNDSTPPQSNWLVDTFFPREVVTDEKELFIGSLNLNNPIAPYVSPLVEGRPIKRNDSLTVRSVPFAYVKPKTALEPATVVDSAVLAQLRAGGMTISGKMSTSDALMIAQTAEAALQRRAIDNRVALMAAEVLTTGKIIVVSDDQPKVEIDYGRDVLAAFTPAIAWTNVATATPVVDFQTMQDKMFALTGSYSGKIVMRTAVWNALIKTDQFKAAFITPNNGIRNVLENTTFNTAENQANLKMKLDNGAEIWTFDGFYTDAAGAKQYYLPAGYCGMVHSAVGLRAFGKIQDIEANFQGFKYYPKTWKNPDPSVLFLMTQSAPMVVPGHANMVVGGVGFV